MQTCLAAVGMKRFDVQVPLTAESDRQIALGLVVWDHPWRFTALGPRAAGILGPKPGIAGFHSCSSDPSDASVEKQLSYCNRYQL